MPYLLAFIQHIIVFFIHKDAGVTIARTTNDSGAVAESECGWLSFVLI